jgi:hypothetical protein
MKYRSFRNIVALAAFVALGGTCYGCYAWWQVGMAQDEQDRRDREKLFQAEKLKAESFARAEAERANAARAAREKQEAQDLATRTATPGAYWSAAPNLRAVDKDALALLDRPVVAKIKDGSKGKPYKINVYADDQRRFNRLKIDLDRDEKADESWTIKPDGAIERKVADADDEKYNHTFRLDITSGWLSLDAPPAAATTTTTATTTSGPAQRPVDADMLRLVKGPAQTKVKDATKGKAYKINLYSDDGARFNRAKVDLNRNDKWDESWTFGADGSVERKVAPADDEKYTETWTFAGGTWKKK